jgi:hypothetical protein
VVFERRRPCRGLRCGGAALEKRKTQLTHGWCDLSTPLSRADAFDAEAAAYERQAVQETAAYGPCYYAELLREMATDRRAWAARLRAELARLLGEDIPAARTIARPEKGTTTPITAGHRRDAA